MNNRYWRLLKETRFSASLGLLLAALTAFSGIALLAVSGWFISAAAIAGTFAATAHAFNFFTPGALVRGLSISRTAGRYGERLVTHEATFRLITLLRTELFGEMAQSRNISQVMNRHDSASQLMQDIKNVEGIYLQAIIPGLTAGITGLGYLITCALFLPSLFWAALPLVLIALLGLPWLYAKRILEPQSQLHLLQNEVWSRTSALFNSVRVLTLTHRLAPEGSKVRESASSAMETELRATEGQVLITLLSQLTLGLLLVCSFGLGIQAFLEGTLSGALIFMLLLLTLGSMEVFAATAPAAANLLLGRLALKRLEGLVNTTQPMKPSVIERRDADRLSVEIRELSFSYPQAQGAVFNDLSLQFDTGWHWLKAPSGWGKTTLFSLLVNELQPDGGEIRFAGINEADVGYMPQQVQLLRASLRDNLQLHKTCTDEQIWAALERVQLADWARSLPEQLDTWVGLGEWQPSGGELKRLALARLLLKEPRLIILDEPFAGMDRALQITLLDNLRAHWSDRVVLISSHDLQVLTDTDRLLDLTR